MADVKIEFGIRPSRESGCIFLDIYAVGYQSTRKIVLDDLWQQLLHWHLFHPDEPFTFKVDKSVMYKGFSLSPHNADNLYLIVSSYVNS